MGQQFHMKDESVDLVYLDPPPLRYDAKYNVRFHEQHASKLVSQVTAFEVRWRWDQTTAKAFQETVEQDRTCCLLINGLVEGASPVDDIDDAFDALYNAAKTMQLSQGEGFHIRLADYCRGVPTYRLVIRIHDDPNLGYVKDYPFPYYLSGDVAPVEAAEATVQGWSNPLELSTSEIHDRLKGLISDCINRFPVLLSAPRLLTLHPSEATQ